MEDVLKRLDDPKLIYTNKQKTVFEIGNLLSHLKFSQLKVPNATIKIRASQSKSEPSLTSYSKYYPKNYSPRSEAALQAGRKVERPHSNSNFRIDDVLTNLEKSKVVAVLRGGHPDRLFQRGCELAQLDCGALEVAMDSYGAMEVLHELAQVLPSSCIVGAATVMTEKAARKAAKAGARFITSPVNPPNFIEWCDSEEVLAIPGGFTPTELYSMLVSGAKAVKLFPACSYTPAGLKQVEQLPSPCCWPTIRLMLDADATAADVERRAIPRSQGYGLRRHRPGSSGRLVGSGGNGSRHRHAGESVYPRYIALVARK